MDKPAPLQSASSQDPRPNNTLLQPTEAPVVIPVLEERVVVEREVVESGRVHISRKVHNFNEQVNIPLEHEEVEVEHVPLNLQLPVGAVAPVTRQEGDTLIIPVVREVAVVETRLVVVEELRITKKYLTTQYTETVPLRREEITVQRDASDKITEKPKAN